MFRVGQKVVCVAANPWALGWTGGPWGKGEELTQNAIYTVIANGFTENGDPAIQIAEIKRVRRWGYNVRRFRPVVDISIFTEMLKPERANV